MRRRCVARRRPSVAVNVVSVRLISTSSTTSAVRHCLLLSGGSRRWNRGHTPPPISTLSFPTRSLPLFFLLYPTLGFFYPSSHLSSFFFFFPPCSSARSFPTSFLLFSPSFPSPPFYFLTPALTPSRRCRELFLVTTYLVNPICTISLIHAMKCPMPMQNLLEFITNKVLFKIIGAMSKGSYCYDW